MCNVKNKGLLYVGMFVEITDKSLGSGFPATGMIFYNALLCCETGGSGELDFIYY